MNASNVIQLDHSAPSVAIAIHALMMASYRVEAGIIGARDFPPLRRTPAEISASSGSFIGIAAAGGALAAVAELDASERGRIHINALVVDPAYFRRGLATALLRDTIQSHALEAITVSTAEANRPALLLYVAAGFCDHDRWTSDNGIAMVTLRREAGARPPGAAG